MRSSYEGIIMKGERERKIRSISKAIAHRILGTLNTFIVAWIFTQNISLSLKVMLARETIAIVIYFVHERFWNKIQWGRYRLEKLEKFQRAQQTETESDKPPVI